MRSIYIVENPLMDYIIHAGPELLERFGAAPGTMRLVEHETFSAVVEAGGQHSLVPGGSGANTARAMAMLLDGETEVYGRVAYSGGIGPDETGRRYRETLESLGIEAALAVKTLPTGSSAIVVTPDHERTMFTHLGACRDYAPEDLRLDILEDSRLFYATGYLWDTPSQLAALDAAVTRAKARRIPVCFDLADPFVVERYYAELRDWLKGRVDLLFANREELSRMADCTGSDAEILRKAAGLAPVIAMKIGKGGCLVLAEGRLAHLPGEQVVPVDTTGAGDSFAAGFLYGYLTGRDLASCARLGNRIASRIVAVDGCRYDLIRREEILSALEG